MTTLTTLSALSAFFIATAFRRLFSFGRVCCLSILPLLVVGMMACSSSPAVADEPDLPGNNTPGGTQGDQQPSSGGTSSEHTLPSQLPGAPVGFACLTAAPTGGEGGQNVTVTTASELGAALKRTEPLIIYVKGELTFSNVLSVKATNKTLLGLSGSKLVSSQRDASTSGILYFKEGSTNLILRNLTFQSAGAYDCDGRDNLCIDGTTRIWVDHCDFQDGVDGNFDCKNASDLITVSYCRFRYLREPLAGGPGGTDDHRFSNLWGGNDSHTQDRGHLRTTFVGCWWDEGCRDRMPRVRYAQVHLVECLYSSSVTSGCIGLGYEASVRAERCVFRNIRKPYKEYNKEDADHRGQIELIDCLFPGGSSAANVGSSFTPSYTLSAPLSSDEVEAAVKREAGATLRIE